MLTLIHFGLSILAVAVALPSPSLNGDIEIVGGQNIDISAAPYQVSVRVNGGHYCGGSIISNSHILSAAHCFGQSAPSQVTVNAGSTYKNMNGQVVQVTRITSHPGYIGPSTNWDFDFAVLKLAQPLQFNNNVNKIPLAAQGSQVPHGQMVRISGWGQTSASKQPSPANLNGTEDSDYSTYSDVLKAVDLPVVANSICQSLLQHTVTENMMCSGGMAQGGQASCRGDSGGPANAGGVLVGVVSWGLDPCAMPNMPSVQARVAAVRSWIDQQMN